MTTSTREGTDIFLCLCGFSCSISQLSLSQRPGGRLNGLADPQGPWNSSLTVDEEEPLEGEIGEERSSRRQPRIRSIMAVTSRTVAWQDVIWMLVSESMKSRAVDTVYVLAGGRRLGTCILGVDRYFTLYLPTTQHSIGSLISLSLSGRNPPYMVAYP